MFVKTHSSNCLSAGMYHNILLQKCISFSEVKNIPRNQIKFAIDSFLSCINATGTSKTILGAVHHAIATRQVYHTETTAIWKFHFIRSFSSECEITVVVVWADSSKVDAGACRIKCHWHKQNNFRSCPSCYRHQTSSSHRNYCYLEASLHWFFQLRM